jgi:hypothetical protein
MILSFSYATCINQVLMSPKFYLAYDIIYTTYMLLEYFYKDLPPSPNHILKEESTALILVNASLGHVGIISCCVQSMRPVSYFKGHCVRTSLPIDTSRNQAGTTDRNQS